MPSAFPTQNGLKQGVLLSLLFSLVLEYAIGKVKVNQETMELNGEHQILIYADINLLGRNKYLQEKYTNSIGH